MKKLRPQRISISHSEIQKHNFFKASQSSREKVSSGSAINCRLRAFRKKEVHWKCNALIWNGIWSLNYLEITSLCMTSQTDLLNYRPHYYYNTYIILEELKVPFSLMSLTHDLCMILQERLFMSLLIMKWRFYLRPYNHLDQFPSI